MVKVKFTSISGKRTKTLFLDAGSVPRKGDYIHIYWDACSSSGTLVEHVENIFHSPRFEQMENSTTVFYSHTAEVELA